MAGGGGLAGHVRALRDYLASCSDRLELRSSSNLKEKMEPTRVVMATVMTMAVMSTMGAVTAAPCFPLDCASYVLEEPAGPPKTCCIEVQDQFLLKKGPGIAAYCKAVTAVMLFNGPLAGTQLDSALSIPAKCTLDSYFKKGLRCAGKIIPGGV